MNKRISVRKIVYACLILLLVLVMIYSGLQIAESAVFHSDMPETEQPKTKTLVREGIEYFPRQDITVMMVLGIDQNGPVADSGSYKNPGAADMVALLIFDEKAETVSVLSLNRDTMLQMPVLGVGGKQAGTAFGQLTLSHTYGSGLEDSCENTRATVSEFLYGVTIDYYLSMNMDAISVLNDAVGGVTVHVTDDFSAVNPTISMGEMTLRGQQAIDFVRTRKDVGDQLNISRMERQKDYISGFLKAMQKKMEESNTFALTAYEDIAPYVVSDISANAFSGILQRYSGYSLAEIVTPEGENVLGEKYYEFYPDEEALDELILRLFYAPKQ